MAPKVLNNFDIYAAAVHEHSGREKTSMSR